MKIKFKRAYTKSETGNKVFVYGVSGTNEELAKYHELQGENYKEDVDGTPLFFTTRSCGQGCDLIITTNNRIIPDMSAFDAAASLAKQYGGNLGEELAKAAAAQLTGKSSTPQNLYVPVPKPEDELPE
jgi:hypothetical protein